MEPPFDEYTYPNGALADYLKLKHALLGDMGRIGGHVIPVVRQTLSIFLSSVLVKKYTNPSSDIITVLAGLDNVDTVFTDFVGTLDSIIRHGRSREWWPTAIVFACKLTGR